MDTLQRARLTAVSAIGLAMVTLTACGGNGTEEPDTAAPDAEQSETEQTTDPAEPTETPSGPCELLSMDDVNAAFGADVSEGNPSTGMTTDNDTSYTSANCTWEGEDFEFRLSVTDAEGFGGELACPELEYLGTVGEPVTGLDARSATWLASEDPNEIEAKLRVCTDTAMHDFEIDAPTGTDLAALEAGAVALAQQAVPTV